MVAVPVVFFFMVVNEVIILFVFFLLVVVMVLVEREAEGRGRVGEVKGSNVQVEVGGQRGHWRSTLQSLLGLCLGGRVEDIFFLRSRRLGEKERGRGKRKGRRR